MSIKTSSTTVSNVTIDAWVARDKNGHLGLYFDKPNKMSCYWLGISTSKVLPINEFPNITWNDMEPTKVSMSIKIA